jgi:hypothetical protein
MTVQDLDFLFNEQKNNSITIIHNRSASGLVPAVRAMYEAIYKAHINDSVNFDWNCSGCIIELLTRLYNKADEFKVNMELPSEEPTVTEIEDAILKEEVGVVDIDDAISKEEVGMVESKPLKGNRKKK